MLSQTNILILSLLGGIVPALFWLWFWIREDRLKPEPKGALFAGFLSGIIALMIALFIELVVYFLFVNVNMPLENRSPTIFWNFLARLAEYYNLADWQVNFWTPLEQSFNNWGFAFRHNLDIHKFILVVISAPIIEETLKLLFVYQVCLRKKVNDEPIDASIYLLTGALGFAAIETALFLTAPLSHGEILNTIIATNFRSFGAMLIHLISSAVLGIFIGLAFYKGRLMKLWYTVAGLFWAIVTHGIFNLFIVMFEATKDRGFFWAATIETWVLVIVLLALFGRIKKTKKPSPFKLVKKEMSMI
jgi:RsiW-degrading membrane proteinase PrsW (M82 family)